MGWEEEANTNMLKTMVVKLFVYLCCYCVAGCVNWVYTVFLYLKKKWREFSPAAMINCFVVCYKMLNSKPSFHGRRHAN